MPRYQIDIQEVPEPDNGPGCGGILLILFIIFILVKACAH